MLFLLPLGALASCPAGLKLSNVPIETALPFCVKWESSSLGGCEVACPGVCVEIPGANTKGPIETTGSECKLGGGDGGDGEGGGETPNPGGGFSTPPKLVGEMSIGGSYVTNIAPGFNALLNESWWIKSGIGDIRNNSFNLNTHAISIQENTDKMVSSLKFLSDKTVESSDKLDKNFKSVLDALDSGGAGSPGEGGSSSEDTAAIKNMMQTAMSWWSMNPNYLQSINNQAAYISGDIGAIKGMTEGMGGAQIKLQTQMAGDLAAIKGMIKDGQGSGGEGGPGIDYSKMPGAADNPLQVAGAEYQSGLCQEGDKCAFDLANINKQYDESKESLKKAYKDIKTEVAEIFKFELNGSGSVPKCFEMYSLFGKSYSVCPSVGGYWEALAAIMMFVFYFIALMIIARR